MTTGAPLVEGKRFSHQQTVCGHPGVLGKPLPEKYEGISGLAQAGLKTF
jgi:hypothetical protein